MISTREGINQDPESLQEMDDLISPLIRKGQSLSHIFATHSDEINCSRSTIYRYINDSVFTARNIDMPRRVKYKARKASDDKKLTKEEKLLVLSRSYERFKKYMEQNPDTDVVEMDTVVGPVSTSKVLLTLLFRSCNLMLIILLKQKTQEEVVCALNWLCDELGIELFKQLFPVILTDRGIEFLNPEAIECDRYGEIKTKLFYCDPQCAWQKGALEKNHEFIRYVVPKGISFEDLTQEEITLIMNHINSLARDKYHGKTPYQLSKVLIDNKLHEVMKLVEIKSDEVCLKPALIKRWHR
ncbi:IS30 family transposase [Butyrivibrio sp. CB08]|uniref:IS30 family transposase n=1 Tax=Butyrivibrio sp. CB08 TaxID=2364879 RepID=UPI001FA9F0A9|nr:IS30 family transposase [Butyrivibrio sp. CB08]